MKVAEETSPPVSPAYLRKLLERAKAGGEGWSEPASAVTVLEKLLKLRKDGMEYNLPTTDGLPYTLSRRGVPEWEIEELMKVPVPAEKAPKGLDPALADKAMDVLREILHTVGDTVGYIARGPEPGPEHYAELKVLLKAFQVIKAKHPRVWAILLRNTKKISFPTRGYGSTAAASWRSGDELWLRLDGKPHRAADLVSTLVHELGHAFEEDYDTQTDLWSVYGAHNPPHVSEYAKKNPSEDFAETFMHYWLEPALLKRSAPAKYADMHSRITTGRPSRIATKTQHEKETGKRLTRKAPTHKPPRHDLQDNSIREEDPDLKGGTAETDKDLSLNYKKVAVQNVLDRHLMRLAAEEAITEDTEFPEIEIPDGETPAEETPAEGEGATETPEEDPSALGDETPTEEDPEAEAAPEGDAPVGDDPSTIEEDDTYVPVTEVLKPDVLEYLQPRLEVEEIDAVSYGEVLAKAKSELRKAMAGEDDTLFEKLYPDPITTPEELAYATLGFRFLKLEGFGALSKEPETVLKSAQRVYCAACHMPQALLDFLVESAEASASQHPDMLARKNALQYAGLVRGPNPGDVSKAYTNLLKGTAKAVGLGPVLLKAPGEIPTQEARAHVRKAVKDFRPEQWRRILPKCLVSDDLLGLLRHPAPYMTGKHNTLLRLFLSDVVGVDMMMLASHMPQDFHKAKAAMDNTFKIFEDGEDILLCGQAAQLARVSMYEDTLSEWVSQNKEEPLPPVMIVARHIAQASNLGPATEDPLSILKSEIYQR